MQARIGIADGCLDGPLFADGGGMRFVFRGAACGDRENERMRIAGLRRGEAAARAVLRTAIFTRVSLTRGRSDFGRRAGVATERKESEIF